MAERKRFGSGAEMDRCKQRADSGSNTIAISKEVPGNASLGSVQRFGCGADCWGDLVAKLGTARTDDVFSCATFVPRARRRCSSERPQCRRSWLSGIRAKECSLDL